MDSAELADRVAQLVEKHWRQHGAPVLLSHLGNADQGEVGRLAKGHSASLAAFIRKYVAARVRIDSGTQTRLLWRPRRDLATPMSVSNLHDMPMETRNQRGEVVGKLIRNARQAIRHARKMLEAVHNELNGRENKTCLSCRRTFGSGLPRHAT